MILRILLSFCLAALAAAELHGEEWLDRLDEKLTVATDDGKLRARLSGTVDLEAYHFSGVPPGLIDTRHDNLFAPRFTFFLDGQIGTKLYFFAQARVDRGFDPGDYVLQGRLEEYALRFTPWEDGRLSIQVGRFATVVGTWTERHLSWDNPFINAPLAYEGITGASDLEVLNRGEKLAPPVRSERYDHLPLIWGPSYATGVSVAGKLGKFTYAAEVKNASLSSRPESWDPTDVGFDHPTFSTRLGYRPDVAWNFGLNASTGPYLRPEAEAELPDGKALGDYRQSLLGADVSFAWRHFQFWAEVYAARFDVPRVGNADALSYFLEAKYKVTPQLFVALRWNQQFFNRVRTEGSSGFERWADDLTRVDAAIGYRFTEHTQLKLQYTVGTGATGSRSADQMVAAQFTLRF